MYQPENQPIPFVRELCKHKTEEEIQEAEENFREFIRYLDRQYDKMKAKQAAMRDKPPP